MNEIIINSEEIKKQVLEISNFFNRDMIEDIAVFTGFVQRKSRKLTGVIFLSVFTLGMNLYKTPTLQQLIGLLNVIIPDLEISREGFHQRINERAVNFFEYMLSQAINISVTKIDLNLVSHFNRVLILDSTLIELPKELSEIFRGSGGSASDSSIKIQFCFDFKLGKFFYFIQEGVNPDNRYDNSFVDKLEQYDLIIKDLGYFILQGFIDISEKGAYHLSRWKSNVSCYIKDEDGKFKKLAMEKFLGEVNSIKEIEAYIKKENQISKVRLVVEKVPEQVKNTRLRDMNKKDKKKGKTSKQMTKIFQGYNVYVSNVPEELLSMENFRKLYGIRWQVELVFKNWKSNFNLEDFSGVRKERILCMLYSKLLLIFISTKIIFQLRNFFWIENGNEISQFKASKHLKIVLGEILKLVLKKEIKKIPQMLEDAVKFIGKNCNKIRQKDRVYPLDLLKSLTLT